MSKLAEVESTMMVQLARLDELLNLAGEVIIVSSNLESMSQTIQSERIGDNAFVSDTRDLAVTSNRISSDLHKLVINIRNVQMHDLFARFRRLARDTARREGKAIDFEVEGEEISLDKTVSEKIYDPIAHQIRNAISHGIEDQKTREALGKNPVGKVKVKIIDSETETRVEISDDGRGIDREAVKAKAVEKGLISEYEADRLSHEETMDFIFHPGFSTAKTTTSTAGRGVGMDVIRHVVDSMGGEIKIKSEDNAGTCCTLLLPRVSAVNIIDALLIKANGHQFAFPVLKVLSNLALPRDSVRSIANRGKLILHLGEYIPYFDLMEVFNESPIEDNDEKFLRVLLVEHRKNKIALRVSDFDSPQKLVVAPLDESIQIPGLSGTAILSGRELALVVDLPSLFEKIQGNKQKINSPAARAMEAAAAEAPVQSHRTVSSQNSRGVHFETPGLAFLQEIEVMLNRMNRDLLELDENRSKEGTDSVFRLAHSIKGNFSMFGAEFESQTTHGLESILDSLRRGTLDFADDVFDILFDGASYLEEALAALMHDEDRPELPDRLKNGLLKYSEDHKADQSVLIDENAESAQVELDPTGEFYLSSRRRTGAALRQFRITFEAGDQPNFLLAYLILRRIQSIADVIGTFPSMAGIESGLCDDYIVVLVALRDNDESIVPKLQKNLEKYYGVTRFEATIRV